jgi:hypothetical protein
MFDSVDLAALWNSYRDGLEGGLGLPRACRAAVTTATLPDTYRKTPVTYLNPRRA